MNKRILTVLLSLILVFNMLLVYAEGSIGAVTAVDGNITVNCTVQEAASRPVLIMVLPQELDTDGVTDITANKVNAVTTLELLNALPVKHTSAVIADAEGKIYSNFILGDEVSTGKYSVVLNYLGSQQGAYVLDTFEHVGKTDVLNFVKSFNDSNAQQYAEIIYKDINGEESSPAKEILRKSSANVTYYKTLEDDSQIQSEFCVVLSGYKPETGFDISTLISSFNKTCAFIRLRNDEDTLKVLGDYNGIYWTLDIDEGTDFAKLGTEEQAKVLSSAKAGKFVDGELIKADFELKTVVGIFHEAETREELDTLISGTGKYADYFTDVRKILADASLNEFEILNVYNSVLVPESKTKCADIEDIEDLFRQSLPVKGGSTGGGGSVGGGSAGGGSVGGGASVVIPGEPVTSTGGGISGSATSVDYSIPFDDVDKSDWSYEYIKKLYQWKTINGVSSNKFAPNDVITRQDFVKILLGVLKIQPSVNESSFTDVEKGSYYEGYVVAATENGLISGMSSQLFGTGNNISRQDTAVIISRVLKKYNKNTDAVAGSFKDETYIADYAKEAVYHTLAEEIFSGDDLGNFNPGANLTRAEACAILCRLADRLER